MQFKTCFLLLYQDLPVSLHTLLSYWLSNSMCDLLPESFKSLQAKLQQLLVWPVTDELQRQKQGSLPRANHRALVSLQGGTSVTARGRRARVGSHLFFIQQYGTVPFKTTSDDRMRREGTAQSGIVAMRGRFSVF